MYRIKKEFSRNKKVFLGILFIPVLSTLCGLVNYLLVGMAENRMFSFLDEKVLAPSIEIAVSFLKWANLDAIRWVWSISFLIFFIIIALGFVVALRERGFAVEKWKSSTTSATVLRIHNETGFDFYDSFIQLRDVSPK